MNWRRLGIRTPEPSQGGRTRIGRLIAGLGLNCRRATLALVALALACAALVQEPGSNQTSHYALLASLADGRVTIDP
jgi:hypothetical protein